MTQLNISNLCFAYNNDKQLFHNFSINLNKNELKTIVGQSGSGKSTIFALISGKQKQQSGKIKIKKFSIVYQDPYSSFHPTFSIYEQILDVVYNIDDIDDILKKLNLNKELLYKRPKDLSGGELQRCSILRAVLMKPKVLLLDEPTSALDNIVAYNVMSMLKSFLDKFSILLITHDKDLASWCEGEIIDIGTKT